MAQFTPEQLEETAEQYHQLAAAVFQRRLASLRAGLALNDPLILQMQSRQIALNGIANQYALQAAGLILDDAESAASLIGDALSRANAAIQRVSEIGKAISIASAAINLSVAIYSGNLAQIAAAVEALLGEVSDGTEPATERAAAKAAGQPSSSSLRSPASETWMGVPGMPRTPPED